MENPKQMVERLGFPTAQPEYHSSEKRSIWYGMGYVDGLFKNQPLDIKNPYYMAGYEEGKNW